MIRLLRATISLALIAVLGASLIPGPAGAYPGPGTWSDIAPPEPAGAPLQLGFQVGSPHVYNLTIVAGIAGFSADVKLTRWLFGSASLDYVVPMSPSVGIGPTFAPGGPGPRGVRVVLAPRVGFDGYTENPQHPSVVVGGHALLDAPLAPDGAARWWLGTRFALSSTPGKDWRSYYLFLLGGITVHVSRPIDLGLQVAGNVLFRSNVGNECGCWIPFHALTFTFQLTVHLGAVAEDRAVVSAPPKRSSG